MDDRITEDEDTNCIYQILMKENNITSRRILELATTEEFEEICTGCVSGDSFLRAVKKMEKYGYIKSSLGKGGYRWQLLVSD
ncbi:MAG: hypothetical protein FK730_13575 [Asgard group archaeon]|nr:hypothetical protein [Asgard group archaeon]